MQSSGNRAHSGTQRVEGHSAKARREAFRLPLSGRLSAPEINQAYKRAAKQVHPDVGGNHSGFLELATARDALMKSL